MKSRVWLASGLIFIVSNILFGQTVATRTITNVDLEKYKQQREKAEAEYRAKHKERGMPSPEELEIQNTENARQRAELSQKLKAENQQVQSYWLERANVLRYEIYNINAQISYLNNQIAVLPSGNQIFLNPGQVNIATYYDYGYRRNHKNQPQMPKSNPATSIQTVTNASAANPNPFYGTPLYSTGIKLVVGPATPNYSRQGHGKYYGNYGYSVQYPVNGYSLQRQELISRLQYLGQVRAGLFAQWNILVEEARRAGVRLDF